MKTCPSCGSSINDPEILYCPIDGAFLVSSIQGSDGELTGNGTDWESPNNDYSPSQGPSAWEVEEEEIPIPTEQGSPNLQRGADKKSRRSRLFAIISVLLVGLIGVGVWYFFLRGPQPGDVIENSLGIELVWIPEGRHTIGLKESQVQGILNMCEPLGCLPEQIRGEISGVEIEFKKGFWIGRYEVTQGQWKKMMGDNPSAFSKCGDDCPVESVSWDDAQRFIQKLNETDKDYFYSLPSQAEWEYAANAGSKEFFSFGDSISGTDANFDSSYPFNSAVKGTPVGSTTKVGNYKANDWNVSDMHGNVYEWVQDVFTQDLSSIPANGRASETGSLQYMKVAKGGSWLSKGFSLRSSSRNQFSQSFKNHHIGFRVLARPVER